MSNSVRETWPDLDWIPKGTRFGTEEMLFHRDLPDRELDDVLADVDLIVTGPHASAAFPEEIGPWVHPSLTRRLQRDFTDRSTSPMARRWVELDPNVLYIEDPHPRAVRDANRDRPSDLGATLRQAFDRIRAAGEGRPDLTGVDPIRPVTFGFHPVLVHPADDTEWNELTAAFIAAGANGIDAYEALRDQVIERTIEIKLRRLAELDPDQTTAAHWRGATTLIVMSLHDTMNLTANADGSVCNERLPADRLPDVVAISNYGDADGEARGSSDGSLFGESEVLSCAPRTVRALARAQRLANDAFEPGDVVFNKPYVGGHETSVASRRLREIAPQAVVRASDGGRLRLDLGAVQYEYLREFLLGADATAELTEPGVGWPEIPADHIESVAAGMAKAHQLFRRWGAELTVPTTK